MDGTKYISVPDSMEIHQKVEDTRRWHGVWYAGDERNGWSWQPFVEEKGLDVVWDSKLPDIAPMEVTFLPEFPRICGNQSLLKMDHTVTAGKSQAGRQPSDTVWTPSNAKLVVESGRASDRFRFSLGMSHDQWMMRVRLVKAVLDMIDSFYRLLVVGGTLSVPIKPKVYQFVLSMKNM